MRRFNRYWTPLILGLSIMGVFLMTLIGNQGCSNKMPSSTTFVATATPTLPPNIIDNLEDGDTYLNPSMCGVGPTGVPKGFWVASTWGGNTVNNPYVFCGDVGANGTSCAIHLFGDVTDKNDGQYPSFQLEAMLEGRKQFDTTVYGYHGVKFFLKVGTDDTCVYRRFNVPIVAIAPPTYGGTCPTNCFDHFGANLTTTNGLWVQKTYYFNSTFGTPTLTRGGWGNPIVPTTFTGVNLQQLLELEWQFGRNGSTGTSHVDYWVDEVEFF